MSPHSPIRWGMPPMLDVALAELMGCRAQEMLAQQDRFGVDEGHRVLQLIAKSECATRLIKTGASPQTAAQNLIEQPAVGHQVDRCVRRFHPDCAKCSLPIPTNAIQSCPDGPDLTIAFDQALRVRQTATGSQAKTDFSFLSVRQIKRDLHGAARIQSNSGFT